MFRSRSTKPEHSARLPEPVAISAGDDLARVLRYLELTVTRRLDGLLRGTFPSSTPGPGTDPDSAREYVVGDDVRRMDWAVSARTGVAHVRDPEAERELECWIVADCAARLSTGSGPVSKRHLLTAACAAVSLLNDGPGDRTGLIADSAVVSPAAGRDHAMRLVRTVALHHGGGTLASDVASVAHRAPRAGLIVVVSDFLGPIDWADALRVANTHTEIMAIRLVDPADEALPGSGPVVMADAETGETVEVTIDQKTRDRYAEAAGDHVAAVSAALRRARARVITLRTDSDWVADFAQQMGHRQ